VTHRCLSRPSTRLALALIVIVVIGTACTPPGIGAQGRHPNPKFCQALKDKKIVASQGAQMYCFGAQLNQASTSRRAEVNALAVTPQNVEASNLAEDVSPSGTRGYGQSETSVAANGPYVVEAWNDATSFFSPCGSPQYKEEATGYAFSANGGQTFTDLGGLPNNNCSFETGFLYQGDPSVETVTIGGVRYFYIASLFNSLNGTGPSKLAMAVCTATGSGSGANLACSQPIVIAQSSVCDSFDSFQFCSFLDKEFLTVDPVRQRLYASYTEFALDPKTFDEASIIELAACDISNPTVPVCRNGRGSGPRPPYMVVTSADPNFCENEGAYPVVDLGTGDVYVAYEHNVDTNLFNAACFGDPVRNVIKRIPFARLTLPTASGGPSNTAAINITSMDGAFVPGYNRFPANDFPRIAVSGVFHTVSIVWNDARYHPLGDILMQSYQLGTLAPASGLVRLNRNTGGLHFLPGLRNADAAGTLNVTWYERATGNTTLTNVMEAAGVSPKATTTPATNALITNVATDWNGVSSDIVPNFGDYTDNYVVASGTAPYVGSTVAISWSDGRSGAPQAFFAKR
jgi:hypothetical protein